MNKRTFLKCGMAIIGGMLFAPVSKVFSIKEEIPKISNLSRDTIDITDLDSKSGYQEFVGGEYNFDVNLNCDKQIKVGDTLKIQWDGTKLGEQAIKCKVMSKTRKGMESIVHIKARPVYDQPQVGTQIVWSKV